jgi:hypothetical protein
MAARTHPHLNPHIALPDPDEAEFGRLCYAAAWFDELAHRPGEEHKILSFIGANDFKNLDDVLALVPRAAIEDLVTLVRVAARSDLAAMRARPSAAAVTTGPLFAGGADGDLIVASILIDIKTTMHPARHLRCGIRQLLVYLLIDYSDEHAITGIGLYLARQGHMCTWELSELLPDLGATASLGTLRNGCAGGAPVTALFQGRRPRRAEHPRDDAATRQRYARRAARHHAREVRAQCPAPRHDVGQPPEEDARSKAQHERPGETAS